MERKTSKTDNSAKKSTKSACCSSSTTSRSQATTKNCGGKCTKPTKNTRNASKSKSGVKSCS